MARRFRGRLLRITVHNPLGVCKGVNKMSVDEKIIAGNLIPLDLPGDENRVEVWLGK